eukprot:XP_001697044.1 predicted protein [Chlamydomonas reinhardtii]
MASGYVAAREAIDKLLADVGGLLADLTSAETPDSDAEAEDARRVIDAQVSKFWQGYYELKRRHDESALSVAGWGAEMGRVCLLDTPGPNEAGEEQLKHQVERLLEGVDCVLYLLDYTKLKTAEEEGLFRRLRAINPQLVARLSSRLFFIVNKVDACETSEGLDPDQVLLLSARNALLARLVRNVALACRSCLQRNVAVLQAQAGALRRELDEAAAAFEEVRGRADAVQSEVVGEVSRRGEGTQELVCEVRGASLSMFTAASSSLPPGSGPSALVPQARSRSRDELAALLLDLHDDLMNQACAASRHAELLSALNTHLAALSRRVEGAVSEALEVRLAPADIRLRPPSAEELHSDVAELIERGIRESNEKHIRVGTRTTTERVFRQPAGPPSLCRWGGYWVDVPRTRTVVETYSATVYCLRPDEIANHFIGLVDGAVSASEAALGAYVAALVEAQLAAARERIREYGDRYLGAMNAALAASARGAEFRGAALAAVDGYVEQEEDAVVAQVAPDDVAAAGTGADQYGGEDADPDDDERVCAQPMAAASDVLGAALEAELEALRSV